MKLERNDFKKYALFLFLIVAAACAAFYLRGGAVDSVKYEYFKAKKGSLRSAMPLHGVIEAREKVEIFAPFMGIVEYLRPEGDYVKKGDVIARFETELYREQLEENKLQKRQIDIDLQVGMDENELKTIEKRNRKIYEALSKTKNEVMYRQMKFGLDYAKKIDYEYDIQNTEIEIQNMTQELSEKEILKKNGFISETEINDIKYQIYSKKKELETSKLNLEKLLRGIDIKQLADKEKDIKNDSLSVELASISYETILVTKKSLRKGIQNRLNNVMREISYAQDLLEKSEVKAPIDGIVIYGKTWITEGQQEKVKVGSNIFEGWSFMSVSSLDDMNILFKINEVDISKVRKGQKVDFSLASNPGAPLKAEIIDIGNVAQVSENDANQTCNIYVKAKILANARELNLKPGMSVNAELILEERDNVIMLPKEAITDRGTVVINGPLQSERKVETGISNLFMCEIKAGVAEGEEAVFQKKAGAVRQGVEFSRNGGGYVVKKGRVSEMIKEIGELAPENKTNVAVKFTGKINWIVEEGKTIARSDEIALIDVKEKKDKMMEKELRAKVLEKEKKLIEERAGADIMALENSLKVKSMDKMIAELDYEILVMPLKKENRKDFEISIKLCANSLKGIENEYTSKGEMTKKGYISQNELNKIKIRLNKARSSLEISRYKYDYEKSLPLPNNVIKSKIELEKIALDYELTKMKLEKRKQKMQFELEKNRIQKRSNDYMVNEFKNVVEAANVKAPISGTAIYVSKWSNEGLKKIKEGTITRANMTFLEIANLDKFLINGSIPEEQFNKISIGQKVEFYLPANPDVRYEGKIKSIGLFAREKETALFSFMNTQAQTETPKFFDVEIETSALNPKFQPGISVYFEIALDSRNNVVKIPRKSLFKDEEGYFVYLASAQRRRVKAGIKSIDEVEIVEGLSEGDAIAY